MPELIVRKWDGPYSFMIFREYGVYKARRGDTGEIQFKDKNAATVVESAINALTPGRTWKETILFKGEMELSRHIELASYLRLVNGKFRAAPSFTDPYLIGQTARVEHVDLINIEMNASNSNLHGLLVRARHFLLQNIRIYNAPRRGLYITFDTSDNPSTDGLVENVEVYNCYYGLELSGRTDGMYQPTHVTLRHIRAHHNTSIGARMISCLRCIGEDIHTYNNDEHGFELGYVSEKCIIRGLQTYQNGLYGALFTYSSDPTKSKNHIIDGVISYSNGQHGIQLFLTNSSVFNIIAMDNQYDGINIGAGSNSVNLYNIYAVNNNLVGAGYKDLRDKSGGITVHEPWTLGTFSLTAGSLIIQRNRGTATIPNGSSSVVVNHGLAGTPSVVKLTGTHSEVKDCWVTNVTSTQFTINAPAAVSADRDVYWQAEL